MFMDLVKLTGNVKRNLEIIQKVIKLREKELFFVWERKLRKEAKREIQWWKEKELHTKEHLNILINKIKKYEEKD